MLRNGEDNRTEEVRVRKDGVNAALKGQKETMRRWMDGRRAHEREIKVSS